MNKELGQLEETMYDHNKCSFMLRIWRVKQFDKHDWRASVEISETGQRIGFGSLEQLFAFLIDFTEGNYTLPTKGNNEEEIRNL